MQSGVELSWDSLTSGPDASDIISRGECVGVVARFRVRDDAGGTSTPKAGDGAYQVPGIVFVWQRYVAEQACLRSCTKHTSNASPDTKPTRTHLPFPPLSPPQYPKSPYLSNAHTHSHSRPLHTHLSARLTHPKQANLHRPFPLELVLHNSHPTHSIRGASMAVDLSEAFVWAGERNVGLPEIPPSLATGKAEGEGEGLGVGAPDIRIRVELVPVAGTGRWEVPSVRVFVPVGDGEEGEGGGEDGAVEKVEIVVGGGGDGGDVDGMVLVRP